MWAGIILHAAVLVGIDARVGSDIVVIAAHV